MSWWKNRHMYLIHVENEDGTLWHYIGVTSKRTLNERIRRHMYGATKSFDHLAAKSARKIGIWTIANAPDVGHERILQALDETHVRRFVCPHCRRVLSESEKIAPANPFDLLEQEEVTLQDDYN